MVLQAARVRPAPWEAALDDVLRRTDGSGVDWWLGGSAALAVQGVAVQPRDIDLVADAAGALRLGELLEDALVEPVAPVVDWVCEWFGRAFVGARVEWVGGVRARADKPELGDFGAAAQRSLETVVWRGHRLRVAPLALQLAVTERRGLAKRADAIRSVLASHVG